MANRKRPIVLRCPVTAEERALIEQKMAQLPTQRIGAYLRKMAIDGYIIYTDTADIQNNIKAQQSAGYRRWATIENLKRIADTSNFLTEHGIGSYEELLNRREAASVSAAQLKADLRDTGAKIDELALKMKHVGTYRQHKPTYDRYKASRDKEKFLRGHESEIILFEAAARECKRLGAVPLPATERMQAEMAGLDAKKAALKAELQKAQREEQDYAAMRRNVEDFLSPPQPEQEHRKNMELE